MDNRILAEILEGLRKQSRFDGRALKTAIAVLLVFLGLYMPFKVWHVAAEVPAKKRMKLTICLATNRSLS